MAEPDPFAQSAFPNRQVGAGPISNPYGARVAGQIKIDYSDLDKTAKAVENLTRRWKELADAVASLSSPRVQQALSAIGAVGAGGAGGGANPASRYNQSMRPPDDDIFAIRDDRDVRPDRRHRALNFARTAVDNPVVQFGAAAIGLGGAWFARNYSENTAADIVQQRMVGASGRSGFNMGTASDYARSMMTQDSGAQGRADFYAGYSMLQQNYGNVGPGNGFYNSAQQMAFLPGQNLESAAGMLTSMTANRQGFIQQVRYGITPLRQTGDFNTFAQQANRVALMGGERSSAQLATLGPSSNYFANLMRATGGDEAQAEAIRQYNIYQQRWVEMGHSRGSFNFTSESVRDELGMDDSMVQTLREASNAQGMRDENRFGDMRGGMEHVASASEELASKISTLTAPIQALANAFGGGLSPWAGMGGTVAGFMQQAAFTRMAFGGGGPFGQGPGVASRVLQNLGPTAATAAGGAGGVLNSAAGTGTSMVAVRAGGSALAGSAITGGLALAGAGATAGSVALDDWLGRRNNGFLAEHTQQFLRFNPLTGPGLLGGRIAQGVGHLLGIGDAIEAAPGTSGSYRTPALPSSVGNMSEAQAMDIIRGRGIPGNGIQGIMGIRGDLKKQLAAMMLVNPRLTLTSGYRDPAMQAQMRAEYERKVAAGEHPAPVARPGQSNHQFGTAVDIGPSSQYGWLAANAPRFGLRLPMPRVEPWHWETPDARQFKEYVAGNGGAVPVTQDGGVAPGGSGGGVTLDAAGGGIRRPSTNILGSVDVVGAVLSGLQSPGAGGGSVSGASSATGGGGAGGSQALPSNVGGGVLTAQAVAALAKGVGLRGQKVIDAVSIAKGESGWNSGAVGDTTITTDKWGPSIGLWQIRSLKEQRGTGGERDADRLLDPSFNARSMYGVSGGGNNWGPWSVWKNGTAQGYMPEVRQALANYDIGDPVTPAPMARPTSTPVMVGGGTTVQLNADITINTSGYTPQEAERLANELAPMLAQKLETTTQRGR